MHLGGSMDPVVKLTESEDKACRYLARLCWKNLRRFCPRCEIKSPYRLADGRYRCRDCGYTFHDFSGRWINRGNLSCRQWLGVLDLFEQGISTREIAARLHVSYNTAYKAITTVRLAIIDHSLDRQVWLGEKGENLDRILGQDQIFGILQRNGKISIVPVPELSREQLFQTPLRMVRRGRIIYSDRFENYASLVFFCQEVDENYRFSRAGIINGLTCFWRFLRHRINRKITSEKFPLFLKEMEFRYNYQDTRLWPVLSEYLCDFESGR